MSYNPEYQKTKHNVIYNWLMFMLLVILSVVGLGVWIHNAEQDKRLKEEMKRSNELNDRVIERIRK